MISFSTKIYPYYISYIIDFVKIIENQHQNRILNFISIYRTNKLFCFPILQSSTFLWSWHWCILFNNLIKNRIPIYSLSIFFINLLSLNKFGITIFFLILFLGYRFAYNITLSNKIMP